MREGARASPDVAALLNVLHDFFLILARIGRIAAKEYKSDHANGPQVALSPILLTEDLGRDIVGRAHGGLELTGEQGRW